MVFAAPQAPENTVKRRTAVMADVFRPKMSLSFAHIIRKPTFSLSSARLSIQFLTNQYMLGDMPSRPSYSD